MYIRATSIMSLRLGDIAPDFAAETTAGPIRFHEYLGNGWGILFSHPADFTPVCTTELGRVAALRHEFERRNVKVLALSVDGLESHRQWIHDINATQQVELDFPLIADSDKKNRDTLRHDPPQRFGYPDGAFTLCHWSR